MPLAWQGQFLNTMKKQNTIFTFAFLFPFVRLILIPCSADVLPPDNLIFWFPLYLCAFVPMLFVNLGNIYLSNPFNQRNQRLKTQSIKNNKLCETKPIPEKPEMNLTLYSTMIITTNHQLLTIQNKAKQSQPVVSLSNQFYPPLLFGGQSQLFDFFIVSLSNLSL